jgi:hypothetical protein
MALLAHLQCLWGLARLHVQTYDSSTQQHAQLAVIISKTLVLWKQQHSGVECSR